MEVVLATYLRATLIAFSVVPSPKTTSKLIFFFAKSFDREVKNEFFRVYFKSIGEYLLIPISDLEFVNSLFGKHAKKSKREPP